MTTTTDTITREIKYSRQDRDYACYVEGQYIGSRANYSDAETLCDQIVADMLADAACATATELDSGSDIDTIAADALLTEADAVLAGPDCGACGGAHSIQHCPEVRAALFAPVCPTCADDGYIEAGGWGDQAGGWAQTCPDCGGQQAAPIGAAPGPVPLQPIAAMVLL